MTFEDIVARAAPYSPDVPACWGTTLVVAPHPDDESLGCGGAIALLRQQEHTVYVLFVSDGSMSHPNSQRYSAEARRDLREREAQSALALLGVPSSNVTFLRLPDTQVPTQPLPTTLPSVPSVKSVRPFDEATTLIHHHLQRIRPQTLLVPWRRDPHGDHRATWQLLRAAIDRTDFSIHWIEYPIWVWETTQPEDLPTDTDGTWFKLAITEVISQKKQAIAAHVSQTTSLIDDDPNGFTLRPEMIGHFVQPYEYYLEP